VWLPTLCGPKSEVRGLKSEVRGSEVQSPEVRGLPFAAKPAQQKAESPYLPWLVSLARPSKIVIPITKCRDVGYLSAN